MKRRRPFSPAEKLLVFSPLLILALIGAWQLWRRNFAPPFLPSPVRPTQLRGTPDGQVIGWGYPETAYFTTSAFAPNTMPNHASSPVFLRWNAETRQLESQTGVAVRPRKSTLSPDGNKLAFISQQPINRFGPYWIEVRDIANIAVPGARWPIDSGSANLSWTPDDRHVISCDQQARVYEAATGKLRRTIDLRRWLPDGLGIESVTFSPDGRRAAFLEKTGYLKGTPDLYGGTNDDGGDIKGRLLIVSWPDLKLQASLPGDLWESCTWTKDGSQLVALTHVMAGYTALQTRIARFDFAARRTSWAVVQRPYKVVYSEPLTFSPGGRSLVAAKGARGGWVVWDALTGRFLGTMGTHTIFQNGNESSMHDAGFSADGRYLLSPTREGVEMWDLERLRLH